MPQLLDPTTKIGGLEERTVTDFWAWAYSDLMSNTVRPMFAEYLVGECLGLTGTPRLEWDCVDFRYRGCDIEVKSSAYVQTWEQKAPSIIKFDISGKEAPWDATKNVNRPSGRSADVYVFAVHLDRSRDDCFIHDTSRWEFYVLSAQAINHAFRNQQSVRLSRVSDICTPVAYPDLRRRIDQTVEELRGAPR